MNAPSSVLQRFLPDDAPGSLTLFVDTPAGTHVRRIPPALQLPTGIVAGLAAEEAAHAAAAMWGMPDFVYQQAAHATKGSGVRELGDRLLLAGPRGAVVQVKARTIAPKQDPQEVAWIQKVATKAMHQAKGTVRQLRLLPYGTVNGRGRAMTVDGNDYEWIAVFLLDHPGVPRGTVAALPAIGIPAIALTRRDWDFLFDQLRSTTAVLDYLFRAAVEPAVPLGDEPLRYYEFASADAEAPKKVIDTELVGSGGILFSAPLLPTAPAGADGTNAHLMIRLMLEDIALTPIDETHTETQRFTMLCALDRLPVSARAEWGRLLLEMLSDVPNASDDEVRWRFRRLVDEDGTAQIIVGAATRFSPVIQASFSAYVQLRHHEVTTRTGRAADSATVGVLLTPRHDGHRLWDTSTVHVHGDLELSDEEIRVYGNAWNRAVDNGEPTVTA